MGRAQIAALLAGGYLLFIFVRYRLALMRRRKDGPALQLLRRFDYRAALGEAVATTRSSPSGGGEGAGMALLQRRLDAGESPAIGPEPDEVALGLEHVARRLGAGEIDAALTLAERLPLPGATVLKGTVELARAERLRDSGDAFAARQAANTAWRHARQAWQRQPTPAATYLVVHLRLAWQTHALNLEWVVAQAIRQATKALQEHGEASHFYLALAHAHALVGRHEEAIDDMGRALYFSRGDAFYSRVILECACVAKVRPALLARCRAGADARGTAP